MVQMGSHASRPRNSCLRFQIQGGRSGTKPESVTLLNSLTRQSLSDIVGSHEGFLKMVVCLPYTLAVMVIESSQSFNFIMQMLSQWLCKPFDEASDLSSVILLRQASLSVLLKHIESRCECLVLLYVAFHDSLNLGYLFYARKEMLFLGIMMVMH